MDTDQSKPVSVQDPAAKSWTDQWSEAQSALRAIGQAPDADAFRSSVEIFFAACWQIGECVEKEPTLPGVDSEAIVGLLKSSLSMTVCNSFVNKARHRELGIKATAKLERVTERKGAWRASVIYVADERTHTFDAFALAGQCMDDWRAFLVGHGVTPPEQVAT